MPQRRSRERENTDESLRVEREKADRAFGQALEAIDETADAVITLARERADKVLAGARAKTDQESANRRPGAPFPEIIKGERRLEDEVVRKERATADETVRAERAEHGVHFSVGRKETDQNLVGERARADKALATRDEFLGLVSHDLRNMLNTVVGFAALITSEVSEEDHAERVCRHAERIQRAGARMNRLIGDLVDVSSIEAGMLRVTREVGDPTPVVTEALGTFQRQAAAKAVALVAELVPPSALAAFEPARIFQVLANLLSNAIKFTPANGKIVVRVERIGSEMRFAVRDTGPGIPAERLEAVFERFVQIGDNDRRGLGLGLYISKCIVQGHGGRIWAESTIGKGSTFCFTLPIHDAVAPEPA